MPINISTCAVVLAAGKGTRMQSDIPKVLHLLHGRSLIDLTLSQVNQSAINQTVVVVGYAKSAVVAEIESHKYSVDFALQDQQLGTGHAVQMAIPQIKSNTSTVIVTYGDMPFVSSDIFNQLIAKQQQTNAAVVLTSVFFDDPMKPAFGRIKRDINGRIEKIVEQKVASPAELKIQECNAGPVAYDYQWLIKALPKLKRNPQSQEYYLTDLAEEACLEGRLVESIVAENENEVFGINTVEHLSQAILI
ncbi:MAG: NTP transferase domain-containing protein [Patescibacteria group bacterium]|jgi:bifunctional UDP-N-acetylglucosamine pyrophosphorylase/glucosamine-1-phosphate N-acetyltransferase